MKQVINEQIFLQIDDGEQILLTDYDNCTYGTLLEGEEISIDQHFVTMRNLKKIRELCDYYPGIYLGKRLFSRKDCICILGEEDTIKRNIGMSNNLTFTTKYFIEDDRDIDWVRRNLNADDFIRYCADRGMNTMTMTFK